MGRRRTEKPGRVADVLLRSNQRFPRRFQKDIGFLAEGSKKLVKEREISMYGDKGSALSLGSIMSKEEALEAVQIVEKTLKMCRKLLKEIA